MTSEHLPSFSVDGHVAVVTGASRGIGRGIALALGAAGATVAVTARRLDDARSVADEIRTAGGAASAHALDVLHVAGIESAIADVLAAHGRIDLCVANAGLGDNAAALDVTEEHWDSMLDVNLKGAFFTIQACARHMTDRGTGRIVAISSQASTVGIRDHVAYAASKGGMNQMVRVLALEWGSRGVTVNAVAPTFVHTPGTAERLDDPAYLATVVDRIPIGHVGQIRDVVGAVLYLASDAGSLVNGAVVAVDGGWTAQ
ncbi:MAG: SDR family NAD(P)-dependent oxidoreductase [Acidimicrobiales bacterium]